MPENLPDLAFDGRYTPEGFVLSGFASGYIPFAPGTWGTLASMPLFWCLWQYAGVVSLLIAVVLITFAGCWLAWRLLPKMGEQDPGWIVLDEWAGQGLCLLIFLSLSTQAVTLWTWLWALVAFRAFDIIKPWPIRKIEHIGPSWWSIMADDLFAGILAALLLLGIEFL